MNNKKAFQSNANRDSMGYIVNMFQCLEEGEVYSKVQVEQVWTCPEGQGWAQRVPVWLGLRL